jgi:hypothetical protein
MEEIKGLGPGISELKPCVRNFLKRRKLPLFKGTMALKMKGL